MLEDLDVGKKIRDIRKKKYLTQVGAAQKFHTNSSTWSRIESGDKPLDLDLLRKICIEWNLTPNDLLLNENDNQDFISISCIGVSRDKIPQLKKTISAVEESFRK